MGLPGDLSGSIRVAPRELPRPYIGRGFLYHRKEKRESERK